MKGEVSCFCSVGIASWGEDGVGIKISNDEFEIPGAHPVECCGVTVSPIGLDLSGVVSGEGFVLAILVLEAGDDILFERGKSSSALGDDTDTLEDGSSPELSSNVDSKDVALIGRVGLGVVVDKPPGAGG